jgi:hypothetical protein
MNAVYILSLWFTQSSILYNWNKGLEEYEGVFHDARIKFRKFVLGDMLISTDGVQAGCFANLSLGKTEKGSLKP